MNMEYCYLGHVFLRYTSHNCSLVFLTKKKILALRWICDFFSSSIQDVYVFWIHNNILRFSLFWHLSILSNIGLIFQWMENIS